MTGSRNRAPIAVGRCASAGTMCRWSTAASSRRPLFPQGSGSYLTFSSSPSRSAQGQHRRSGHRRYLLALSSEVWYRWGCSWHLEWMVSSGSSSCSSSARCHRHYFFSAAWCVDRLTQRAEESFVLRLFADGRTSIGVYLRSTVHVVSTILMRLMRILMCFFDSACCCGASTSSCSILFRCNTRCLRASLITVANMMIPSLIFPDHQ